MKRGAALLSVESVLATIVILTLTSIVARLISAGLPVISQMGTQVITEVLALGCWWGLNHWYPKAKVSWWRSSEHHQWLLVLPVIVVLLGDSTLNPQFQLRWATFSWLYL